MKRRSATAKSADRFLASETAAAKVERATRPEDVFDLPACGQRSELRAGSWSHVADDHQSIVFEGAQGILLDERCGFYPHVTRGPCTDGNALAMLDEAGWGCEIHRLGVTRAYATRHGHGPFPTYSEHLTLDPAFADAKNKNDPWQGGFRVGWPDAVLLRYAIAANAGVDSIAVTCGDRVRSEWHYCVGYGNDGWRDAVSITPNASATKKALREQVTGYDAAPTYVTYSGRDKDLLLGDLVGVPVSITSRGPTWRDKQEHPWR